jgi:hypothetical protein
VWTTLYLIGYLEHGLSALSGSSLGLDYLEVVVAIWQRLVVVARSNISSLRYQV